MATHHKEMFTYEQMQIQLLEQKNDSFYQMLNKIDESIKDLKNDNKELKSSLNRLEYKVDGNFKWLLTLMIGGFVGLFGLMAHGFHWII